MGSWKLMAGLPLTFFLFRQSSKLHLTTKHAILLLPSYFLNLLWPFLFDIKEMYSYVYGSEERRILSFCCVLNIFPFATILLVRMILKQFQIFRKMEVA